MDAQNTGSTSLVGDLVSGVVEKMTTEIGAVLPIAGGLFALVAGIFIGLKIFKRVTGAKTA